ncbi:MAG: hypothetical protein RLO53_02630 [Salinisphaeraceae bacterium]
MSETDVLRWQDIDQYALASLWESYGLTVHSVAPADPIPGSFWGDEEAGLVGHRLYLRADTPVHSALHEGGHFVCMDGRRRAGLDTDAGGDYDEENGVCYLQLLLADRLPDVGRDRLCRDMDRWGYSFRLGSTAAWFEQDAEDALAWLQHHGIVDKVGSVTWQCRA